MRSISETIKVLVVSNVLFFLGTLVSGDAIYQLFSLYYFDNPQFALWQPLTHMFMLGGWMHLLFNMYALWAFGGPLEAQWGRDKFLFFYFSAGLGAALIHSLVNWYHLAQGVEVLMGMGMTSEEVGQLLNNTLTPGSYRVIPEMGAGVAERLARRVLPQTSDDRELVGEPIEPFAERREWNAVGDVFGLVPTGAESEFNPAARHLVDLRHADRKRTRMPKGGRRHQGAEADG